MFHHDKDVDQEAYRPLAERLDDTDDDAESLRIAGTLQQRRRRCGGGGWRRNTCLAVLFVVCNLISSQIGALLAVASVDMDRECALHTTKYSPLVKDVHIKYEYKKFNGSFMDVDVFRKEAGPEVDAAWESLGVDYRAGVIPASEGAASGLTPAHVQRAEEYGGGFFVNVEGMHHLHCLNLVRKALYFNYDYYRDLGMHAFKNEEPILRLHVTHCLDTVRQVLMCNADTGVLGQVWYNPDHPAAFPDFQTQHKCKNYEAIRDWAEKLQAPPADSLPADYLKKADPAHILPSTP